MNTTATTPATSLITLAADTSATANKAVWTIGDWNVTVTRRTLRDGLVRVRVTRTHRWIAGAAEYHAERSDFRDVPASESDALFVAVVKHWEAHYCA